MYTSRWIMVVMWHRCGDRLDVYIFKWHFLSTDHGTIYFSLKHPFDSAMCYDTIFDYDNYFVIQIQFWVQFRSPVLLLS